MSNSVHHKKIALIITLILSGPLTVLSIIIYQFYSYARDYGNTMAPVHSSTNSSTRILVYIYFTALVLTLLYMFLIKEKDSFKCKHIFIAAIPLFPILIVPFMFYKIQDKTIYAKQSVTKNFYYGYDKSLKGCTLYAKNSNGYQILLGPEIMNIKIIPETNTLIIKKALVVWLGPQKTIYDYNLNYYAIDTTINSLSGPYTRDEIKSKYNITDSDPIFDKAKLMEYIQ